MLETMRAVVCAALFACVAFAQNTDPGQLFRNAVDAQQRGDFALAISDYKRLLEIQPHSVEALANLGAALVHEGRFDEAIANYRQALDAEPGNTAVRLNLALAYYKKGDLRNAADQLVPIAKAEPGNARIATLLADCYLRLGNSDQAIAILTPLEAAHPDDLDMAYVLGSALIGSGKTAEGLVLVERVAKQGNSADAFMMAGKAWLKMNEYARAREDLEAAARLKPNLPGIYTELGITKEEAGDAEGAVKDLRAALDRNRDDFDANVHLGGILYGKRDLDAAKTYIERALEIDPGSVFAVYEMALVKSASGQAEAAASDLETVIARDPNWLAAHVKLAALYYKLNRPADGLRERQIVDQLTAQQEKDGTAQPPRP